MIATMKTMNKYVDLQSSSLTVSARTMTQIFIQMNAHHAWLIILILSYPHFNFPSYAQKLWFLMESKRRILLPWQQKHFFSPSKIVCQTRGKKIMLTTFAEKINCIYKFLQLYQVLFIYLSVLTCKNDLQPAYQLKHRLLLSALSRLSDMQNTSFKSTSEQESKFTVV